ncbi:MAG: hypothetical protein J6N76_08050 [Lachnospiraceae bacterium]|nr:hypothetical protein [Lachnospiraceae bacterium]
MPFIDTKTTVKLSDEQKQTLKAAYAEAAGMIGKPESYLMVGFEDEYDLFFAGERLEKGAYVSVDVYGGSNSAGFEKMTKKICDTLTDELGIPGNRIYVEYRATADWGWNGSNF